MKTLKKFITGSCLDKRGFSLIELMVVVAILGVLAASVGVYIKNESTKLKAFIFNTKTRFNQAKFEAIKRSRNVYLDFDFDGDGNINNGFVIWVDDNSDTDYDAWNNPYVDTNASGDCDSGEGDCNGNGVCDTGEGDCIIDTVVFDNKISGSPQHGPEIFCGAACASGGPAATDGPDGKTIGDGITAGAPKDRFRFEPNGDSGDGVAYFYFPQGQPGAQEVAYGPWAIMVNTVGRIRIDEWKSTITNWDKYPNP